MFLEILETPNGELISMKLTNENNEKLDVLNYERSISEDELVIIAGTKYELTLHSYFHEDDECFYKYELVDHVPQMYKEHDITKYINFK